MMAQMDIFGTSMVDQIVSPTITTTLVNVVLYTQDQWELWIQQIKQRAADANIWTKIDPDQGAPPEFIEKPRIPRYSDIRPGTTRLSELDREEKDDFRSLQETYRVEDTEWVRETNALQSIHQFIRERISVENQAIINTSTNAYETLRLLKNRLHPSDESSKFEVKRQWHMLPLIDPRNQEWEKYVNTWSNIYRRAKTLKLPEVEGKMPHVLFALSIKRLDENWGDQRHSEILASTYVVIDFENLLDSYREYKRQKISFARLNHHDKTRDDIAFNVEDSAPSFQGQNQRGQQTESSRPKCPCGNTFFRHRIASCWYITKKPKEGWEPKPEITERVARAMRDPKIRSMVNTERAARLTAIKATSEEGGTVLRNGNSAFHSTANEYESLNSFHTAAENDGSSSSKKSVEIGKIKPAMAGTASKDEPLDTFNTSTEEPYYFTNAWIIDGASDKHVCNSPYRNNFTKTRETDHRTIKCGRSVYPVECYGTCTIMAKTPDGPKPVTLNDVALCLYFRTNLISAAKMNDRGLHLITFNGGYICSAKKPNTPIYLPQRIKNFWCFEFLPPTHHEFAIHPDGDAFLTTDQKPLRKEVQLDKLLSARASEDLWHERMGHPGPNTLKHLSNAVLGEIIIAHAPATIECNTCATSKATQIISRSHFKEHPATQIFMRINYDIVHMSRGYNGDRYISHFSCEYSSFQFIFTHASKTEASRCCLYVINMIRTHFGISVRYFHTDGETSLGKENTADNDFFNSIREKGIIVEISAPRTQDQNGAAEIHGKHLLVRARSIRIHSRQPYDLWPEHVRCACVLSNRTPMEKLQWKTPFEIVYGKKPTIHYLVSPGSRAYVLNKSIPKNLKTDPRAFVGYHVGYEGTNIYRIWIPSQKRVIRSRDVQFDEKSHEYDPRELDNSILYPGAIEAKIVVRQPPVDSGGMEELDGTIDLLNNQELELEEEEDTQSSLSQKDVSISLAVPVQLPTPESTPTPIDSERQATNSRGAAINENLESGSTQASTRRRLEPGRSGKGRYEYQVTKERTVGVEIDKRNVIESRTRRGQRRKDNTDAMHHTSHETTTFDNPDQFFTTSLAFHTAITAARPHRDQLPPPPRDYYEAKKHPLWSSIETAIQKEYTSIESQGVFELVARGSKMKAIPLKWVFAYKFDSEGYMVKVKARLCVRGDKQEVNDLDTFAATLAAETMRFLFAITAYFDLEMRQFDAVSAFLNCPLDEVVYCQPPAGYPSPGQVWKLRRALYGLRRAPHLWHNELSSYLEGLGLKAVPGVNCVHQNDWLVVFFFVDDIICLYRHENQTSFNAFQKRLCSRYKMSTVGEPQWFLGIGVCRNRTARTLTICQESYIGKICKRFEKSLLQKEVHTPLPSATLLPNEGQASPSQIMEMQQKVGSINFAAVISRPDIALSASMLAEHLQNPSSRHLEAANHCLSYLYYTQSLAITYSGKEDYHNQFAFVDPKYVHISSDASFADDKTTRKSRQGYIFSLFGGPIAWKASKQNTVTTSSTEAELLAVSQVGKEVIWWGNFFREINFNLPEKVSILCDNRQTIRLLTNESPQLTTKLRHVDIHHHWLRQEISRKHVNIEWISTNDIPADGFTKAFTRQKHEHFLRLLNLRPK